MIIDKNLTEAEIPRTAFPPRKRNVREDQKYKVLFQKGTALGTMVSSGAFSSPPLYATNIAYN